MTAGDAPARPLVSLPKAHLHLHLEGAMRPATLVELAERAGIAVPTVRGYASFPAFAEMYLAACVVLRSASDVRRLVFEVVEDAAAAGAVWVEPSLYPPIHRATLGDDSSVVDFVLEALADAAAAHGVGAGLMVAADRTAASEEAIGIAEVAAERSGRGVVSFGIANDEAGAPPEPFAGAFDIARAAGLLSTPHAGELEGPASITGALDALGADRIQHGVRAIEDPRLVERLAASAVCLDVCPTSNVMLGVFPSLADHPLPDLLDAGVRCSVNADDPLLFGPGLLAEYELCRERLGLSDERLARVARCSIEASGAPAELRRDQVARVDAWLADQLEPSGTFG